MDKLMLPADLHQEFGVDAFTEIMALEGKAFRNVRGRKTIQVRLGGVSYFIKQHFGVGWLEIAKNLLSLKKPVLGALTEMQAIQKLTALGVATTPLVGYGVRGVNPARQQSFIITRDLGEIISLEDICADWADSPPEAVFKQKIVIALAQLAAKLHGAGMCHRDFYLCHFVLKKEALAEGRADLILIDLHRVLFGQSSHGRAVIKDIGGLMFSAKDSGLNDADWALFKQHYLPQSTVFWEKVDARANKLYAKFHSAKFQNRLAQEKSAIHQP
ncbi:MAG: lipopolysaccharide core heptose(I) kinase RfaP [Betaproteobacteria bacterium HGW-Betaproteobacteria-22]|nr:MAG: lipopolysaccharide core heptose(I) kinase RfaP [Betaproteobacteria bacterium HGW-Betaproteobacteria-22]